MAKIQSPSGETEFFQITDIEKAFEKELKTGEKVTVAPGVIEASFLREAPVRAEYMEAFQEFKDRLINPYVPPTPPVKRCICALVIKQWIFTYDIADAFDFNGVGVLPEQWYGVISETKGDIYPNLVNQLDFNSAEQGLLTVDSPTGRQYAFPAKTYPNYDRGKIVAGCTESEFLIPDFLTMTGYVGFKDFINIDPEFSGWYGQGGNPITINNGQISFDYTNKTGSTLNYSQTFNATIPSSNTWPPQDPASLAQLPIWTLQADIRKYAGKCYWPQFENFRFTNLYP